MLINEMRHLLKRNPLARFREYASGKLDEREDLIIPNVTMEIIKMNEGS